MKPQRDTEDAKSDTQKDHVFQLVDTIREEAFKTHCYFKNGFLEKVYENSLFRRLKQRGLTVEQQVPLKVYDEDNSVVGEYNADLLIEDSVIIELKAAKALNENHIAQILAYLKTSKLKHGVLINFGAPKLEIRKLVL